jgi:hypothetical protein
MEIALETLGKDRVLGILQQTATVVKQESKIGTTENDKVAPRRSLTSMQPRDRQVRALDAARSGRKFSILTCCVT